MSAEDFPDLIFAANTAPPDSEQAEIFYTEDPSKVSGLARRTYVPAPQISWEQLARAETHPLRVSVLELLTIDGGRVLSPSEMAFELQEQLNKTNYHVTELVKAGFLLLVRTKQRRGAAEHYYRVRGEGSDER